MRKIGTILGALVLFAGGPVHAAGLIEVEKLPPAQVAQTIQAASDDTVIEIKGESKTKAQWRSYFQSKFNQMDLAKLRGVDDKAKAKVAADAKALQDQQDAAVAKQNAQAEAEFETLSGR